MIETGNPDVPSAIRDTGTAELWHRLAQVNSLCVTTLTTVSGNLPGKENATGAGTVVVHESRPGTLVFEEKGAWNRGTRNISFSNRIEWKLLPDSGRILCSHLRYGDDNPEHLATFSESSGSIWTGTEPYLCADDVYEGTLELGPTTLILAWRVTGPHKDQLISCVYS